MVLAEGSNFGPYRILGRLGSGGMASVYHAFQAEPRREVALKVISPDLAERPDFRARFRQEANALAHLEHPNIVPIYEMGEVAGRPYICYRYVRGGTLKDLLTGPLPLAEVVALLAPVADALDFAYARGIIHRDVKPANILLNPPDALGRRTPIVADFGIAKALERALQGGDPTQETPEYSTSLTQVGAGLGTPEYMAPEQALGRQIDGRADQYALAITAYELLCGSVPFSGTTPFEVAFMQVNEPLPLPSSRNRAITPAVEQVLLKALAKNPADRFPSSSAFIAALDEAARTSTNTTPTEAMTLPLPRRTDPTVVLPPRAAAKPWWQRGRLLGAIAVALLALSVAAGAVLATRGSGATHDNRAAAIGLSPTNDPGVFAGGIATAADPVASLVPATRTVTVVPSATATLAPTSAAAPTASPTVAPTAGGTGSSTTPNPSPNGAVLGLAVRDTTGDGALVTSVMAGGPGDQAGVKQGDLVTAIDGTPVYASADLVKAIGEKRPGDRVTLAIRRNGANLALPVTLAPAPQSAACGIFGRCD